MKLIKRGFCLWDADAASEILPTFKMSKMTPFELSRVVFRAIRENRTDVSFWKAVIARAKQVESQLAPADISVIIYGLGKLRYRDRDLLARLGTVVIPNLGSMSLNDISHLLSGYARVQVRNDLLFDLASRVIGRKLASCNALAEVTNITLAYTALNYEHKLLFSALSKRAMLLLPSGSNTRDLANLVDAFSRIPGLETSRLFALASSEICRKIDAFPAQSLALVARSFARAGLLKNQNQFLLEQILDESFKRRHEFDSESKAVLLHAVSKSRNSSKSQLLFDYFTSDLSKRGVEKFDLTALTLLAGAIGKHFKVSDGTSSPPREVHTLFQLIGDRVAALASELGPRQVAVLANAFSQVGSRHGPLLYNLPSHVKEMSKDLSLIEISMILKAYASLSIRNDVLLDCVPPRILELIQESGENSVKSSSLDDSSIYALTVNEPSTAGISNDPKATTKALTDILESYAMLMVGDSKLLNPVIKAIDARKDYLSERELLLVIPKSLSVLMLPCPVDLAALITCKAESSSIPLTDEALGELYQFTEQYAIALEQ